MAIHIACLRDVGVGVVELLLTFDCNVDAKQLQVITYLH